MAKRLPNGKKVERCCDCEGMFLDVVNDRIICLAVNVSPKEAELATDLEIPDWCSLAEWVEKEGTI